MTLMQLSHFNVHFLVTAIIYHTWFNFMSASGTSHISVITRHTTSVISSHKYKSNISHKMYRTGTSMTRTALATESTDLNKLNRRGLQKSQFEVRISDWVPAGTSKCI
jgi:hypothetical protein